MSEERRVRGAGGDVGGTGRAGAGAGAAEPLRLLLGAFGDPGHAFPMIALGRALVARGHRVCLQTWGRWREHVLEAGMEFAAAPEYDVFPTMERHLKPYEAVVRAARESLPLIERFAPGAVVADILTLAPAMAGEMSGVPVATLVPHVHPDNAPGTPPYSMGARRPRTAAGRRLWDLSRPLVEAGLRQGRAELNETRRRLGLGPLDRFHGGLSDRLVLVGTFPQLEYPRRWAAHEHVVGPLMWEPPTEPVSVPAGDGPLVLVAPSTSQDREQQLLRAGMEGLAALRDGEGRAVRVLGTWNRRPPPRAIRVSDGMTLVEWLSYSQVMPACDVVVCHGGHGTVVRALASGAAVVAVPAAGDMNENAARVDWAGVGVRLPRRYAGARSVRLAVERVLGDPAIGARARELASWAAAHDPAVRAAELVEELARRGPGPEPHGDAATHGNAGSRGPTARALS